MKKSAFVMLAGALATLAACSDKDEAMISDNEAADAAAVMPAEETVPAIEEEPSSSSAPSGTDAAAPAPTETP